MYYRYECIVPGSTSKLNPGILTIVDEIFTDRQIWQYAMPFEIWLDGPTCTMSNTISYFTEKGNRKMNKAIRALCRAIDATGKAKTQCVTVKELDVDNILYQDKYQVILLRDTTEEP